MPPLIDYWTNLPDARQAFKDWQYHRGRNVRLEELQNRGYADEQLRNLRKLVGGDGSDLFDVLAHVAFTKELIPRQDRASSALMRIGAYNPKRQEFLRFVLDHVPDGDARPVRDHLGHYALADFGVDERSVGILHFAQLSVQVADTLRRCAPRIRCGLPSRFELVSQLFLLFPAGFEPLPLFSEAVTLGLQLGDVFVAAESGRDVAVEGRQLGVHLVAAAVEVVQRAGVASWLILTRAEAVSSRSTDLSGSWRPER